MDGLWLFNQEGKKKSKYTVPREEVFYEEQAGVIGLRAEDCIRKREMAKESYSSF